MKITDYSFGRITVNGTTYTSDVIIYFDSVNPSWWRKEGHLLQKVDIDGIIQPHITILVIGTGYYGAMEVPESILRYLKSEGVDACQYTTREAVDYYNRLPEKKAVAAALHLTC